MNIIFLRITDCLFFLSKTVNVPLYFVWSLIGMVPKKLLADLVVFTNWLPSRYKKELIDSCKDYLACTFREV